MTKGSLSYQILFTGSKILILAKVIELSNLENAKFGHEKVNLIL